MNLYDYFMRSAKRTPGRIALVYQDRRWTYGELAASVQSLAQSLDAAGVRPGDRVLTISRNRPELWVLFWAVQRLSAALVPLNPQMDGADVAYCIEDTEPAAVFCDDGGASVMTSLPPGHRAPPLVLTSADIHAPRPLAGTTPARPARARSAPRGDDMALMLYTSGVTGPPKGVPRSHCNEIFSSFAHIVQNHGQFSETSLALSPWSHTMGIRTLLTATILSGTLVVPSSCQPSHLLESIARDGVSVLYGVPWIFHQLLLEDPSGRVLRQLKNVGYAGAPMPASVTQQVFAVMRPEHFVNHYGSTEVYTYSVCAELDQKPGSAGKPGVHTETRIVSLNGGEEETLPGEVGQLWVRMTSPEAFRGYWNRADATRQAVVDGWFKTGDLVLRDDDGDLWVKGRVDDRIQIGGRTIWINEIEQALATAPGVADAAVVAVPNAQGDPHLIAYVVAAAAPAAIRQWVEHDRRLYHARPQLFFVEDLPRQSGKLLTRKLAPQQS
ncbi:MAG: class I adenylate-forming enzyme family protein [Thermaerobacter sp.]|nr:class I adenylate-forming enzyme family protein [Thermaerobacter sp.]